MAENLLLDLSQDIGQLLTSGDNYDLIIQAGEGQNMKEFSAHSLILSARSTYFKTALSKEWAKKENGIITFKKPNISPEIMELILGYLYTGLVNFDKQNGAKVLKLLMASDELNLQKLSDYIQTYLLDNQAEYLKNEPIDVLQIVFRYEGCEDLRKFCLDTICKDPKILFESPKFTSLDKDLIILFLKNNELEMEEIEIWEFILKWALTRMSTQHNVDNLSQWTSSNFEELEKILRDLIPHIRWFQIPSNLFWRKVSQFESIFPKQLYRDIMGYYCDPDTPPINAILPLRRNLSNIDSILIDRGHLSIIASWIDNKEKSFYNIKSIPYLFKLVYRASRDGFEAAKFHELCDNKDSTIMISKLKENGRLIGGYNPLSWQSYNTFINDNGSWQSTPESFLFSFTKKDEIDSAFLIRVNFASKNYAVCYGLNYGPAFGSGWDLVIKHDNVRTYGNSTYFNVYDIIDYGKDHSLEDYEVYQVAKK
ncbi:BTB/POZ protein [Rhizophagus clarus]|uniref:BTB/POZ protein n=1 Tax=Rhizophagus clarus TaxID=94130 RepID=A0A8H3QKM7_9GLOM|nr:BTB/POZ protein [Rhizophagus clarus]